MLALGLLALLPAAAGAQDAAELPPEPPAEASPDVADPAPLEAPDEDTALSWRGTVEWLAAYTLAEVAASEANPGNRYLALPRTRAFTELRPNLRVELGSRWEFVLRPRLALQAEQARVDSQWRPGRTTPAAEWIEAFAAWRVSDALSLAYGLQNFQWGPAEAVSPSNRLFHDTSFTRTPLSFYRGRYLARVNLSPERNFSTLFLMETHANEDAPFVAGEAFERRWLLKLEYAFDGGPHYLGAVLGGGERSETWVGEYASWSPTDAVSLYLDAAHMRGSRAWYPVERAGRLGFEQSRLGESQLRTFGVVGARYAFEQGSDARLEYLHHEAGYTRDELERAVRLVRDVAPLDARVLAPYASPGLEVSGRSYLYLSARIPDVGPGKRLSAHARYLLSLADRSGSALVNLQWTASDAWVLYLSAGATHGRDDLDLTRALRASILLATQHTW